MKGDLIERDDVLKEIWEWIANREYQYTNATHWLQKRIEAIPCAEDKADRKTENSSEKPNNSTISKMEQVDKDINVRSKDEPQTMLNDGTLVINVEDATKVGRVLIGDDKNRGGLYYPDDEDEPQTCSVSGRPYSECADCEHFRCTADEPQTEEWYTYQDEQEYNDRWQTERSE